MGDVKTPVYTGVISVIIDVVLCLLLVKPLEHGGLAFANSLAAYVNIILLYIVLCRKLPSMQPKKFFMDNAKMLLAAAVMAGAVLAVDSISALSGSTILLALRMCLAIGVGCLVYAVCAWLFKIEGLRELFAKLKNKKEIDVE